MRPRPSRRRPVVAAATVAVALLLAGCAGDPDLADVRDGVADLPGVTGATMFVQHSGAPWNTATVMNLFVEDGSSTAIIDTTRAAAAVIADDPEVARHPVALSFVEGMPEDFPDGPGYGDRAVIMPDVYLALGLPDGSPEFIRIDPGELDRIAEGRSPARSRR